MTVPSALANTMELILVRSMPTPGAVAVMVIGPPAAAQSPTRRSIGLNQCKQHAGARRPRLSRVRNSGRQTRGFAALHARDKDPANGEANPFVRYPPGI